MAQEDAEPERIWQAFAYAENDKKLFRWANDYSTRVALHRERINADPAARKRYMLAGLYLLYRAANHQGLTLATNRECIDLLPGGEKLDTYLRNGGDQFHSTAEYLSKLNFDLDAWAKKGIGESLAEFVLSGPEA